MAVSKGTRKGPLREKRLKLRDRLSHLPKFVIELLSDQKNETKER